ncbi:MAG: hypothetical protein IT376_21870 [Polyangiaceae bacterium]|nr:hypothetical protein [Polyangiaceae bacterium]
MPKGPKTPTDPDRDEALDEDDARDEDELAATDGDEDDDEELERRARARKARARRRARGRGGSSAAGPARPSRRVAPPATEAALDSPNRQTLGMLGAVVIATLGMWVFAQKSCNLHPAETRKPRELAVAQLTREPKNAALELQQRWSGYDFAGASELARGEVRAQIEKDAAGCGGDACSRQRGELADATLARSVLVTRNATQAVVRVEVLRGIGSPGTYLVTLELEGTTWVAVRHVKDSGAAVPSLGGEGPTEPSPPASAGETPGATSAASPPGAASAAPAASAAAARPAASAQPPGAAASSSPP